MAIECIATDAGFFHGLWHGLTAIFSLIGGFFWEVRMYDRCQESWWYDFGFALGFMIMGTIGFHDIRIALILLTATLITWLVWMLFTSTIGIVLTIIIVSIAIAALFIEETRP